MLAEYFAISRGIGMTHLGHCADVEGSRAVRGRTDGIWQLRICSPSNHSAYKGFIAMSSFEREILAPDAHLSLTT